MEVTFRRTGERGYAVIVSPPGREPQTMNPAPGFDPHIPHDLVHYVVEAELRLDGGVFGRAARGAGTFLSTASTATPRERARQRRRQGRREQAAQREGTYALQMKSSERLAYLCDIAWRRRHGQKPDPSRWHAPEPLSDADNAYIERVVARLEQLADAWNQLPVSGELVFEWPSLQPKMRTR
jgi:hypothetical protein